MFVATEDGLVNLDHVAEIRIRISDGKYLLFGKNNDRVIGICERNTVPISNVFVPKDSWEIVHKPNQEPDGAWFVYVEPVLAFGIDIEGGIVPLTSMGDLTWNDDCGLRKVGSDLIDVPFDCTYDNQAAWIEALERKLKSSQTTS